MKERKKEDVERLVGYGLVHGFVVEDLTDEEIRILDHNTWLLKKQNERA